MLHLRIKYYLANLQRKKPFERMLLGNNILPLVIQIKSEWKQIIKAEILINSINIKDCFRREFRKPLSASTTRRFLIGRHIRWSIDTGNRDMSNSGSFSDTPTMRILGENTIRGTCSGQRIPFRTKCYPKRCILYIDPRYNMRGAIRSNHA